MHVVSRTWWRTTAQYAVIISVLNVTAGQSVERASFEATLRHLAISVHTTGSDLPASYQVAVNGGPSGLPRDQWFGSVSRLRAGTYSVALSIPSDNCTVAGGKLKTVERYRRAP
jgi:hypothetical protein